MSDDITYAPSICYESVLPHVIRGQVVELSAAGKRPDVLVNLTNDAWYWGSSELDMHLACDVFRAVEMRTPMVIAANGGLSAHIDACGRIVDQIPRQKPDLILADVVLDDRVSLYSATGDWFAGACALCCALLALSVVIHWWRSEPRDSGRS
jgi:apolipoprotein N-acyltransferase